MPNLYPPKEKNARGTDSAPIFGDVNQSETLSEIKLPLWKSSMSNNNKNIQIVSLYLGPPKIFLGDNVGLFLRRFQITCQMYVNVFYI